MTDKETLRTVLITQGYTERNAELVAQELMDLSPELSPCLDLWLHHLKWSKLILSEPVAGGWMMDKSLDYESNGYSIIGLMIDRHMTYPAALLTMDWIIKEPEKALLSLKKGVR